jgi:hypothetical protein
MNHDKDILRGLAGRVREIAELPEMKTRKAEWYRHNGLTPGKPLILCFPEGAWIELLPDSVLECSDKKLRDWEMKLRQQIYWWEHLRDDHVLEPFFGINWRVDIGDYGVTVPMHHGENRGSYSWEPPLKDLEKDMDKIHFRSLTVDREGTQADLAEAQSLFGDLLTPRIRGSFYWTSGLTWDAIKLVGLENLMLLMYDAPEQLHRLMAWLRDEHLHFIHWLESERLLSLNNEADYTGSGGVGYSRELEQGRDAGAPVRLRERWGFAESQETVGVGPDMFAEFILPYQIPILEEFGLNCYGCCEALHQRWEHVRKAPRLRRISVSPWCDQEKMAEQLGGKYIFSRKPNPSAVCINFNEDALRKDIRTTLQIAGKGILEIILKDTHTVQNDPTRLTRWIKLAMEERDEYVDSL